MRGHDYGGAAPDHRVDMCEEVAASRSIYSCEWLIQQQQLGSTHPRTGEQHSPQLPIRQLDQGSQREVRETEKRQRTSCGGPIRGGRRVVEPDARVPTGLDDFRDRKLLRVVGL